MLAVVALPRAQAPAEKLDYATIAQDPRRRAEPLAGDGSHQLAERRLRSAPDRRPGHHAGRDWAMKKFGEWGLANAHRETLAVRQGLVARPLQRAPDRAAGPAAHRLSRLVVARHQRHRRPPTSSASQIDSDADFEKYRGTLTGKIVLTQPARAVRMLEGPFILRMSDKDFEEAATTPIPRGARPARARRRAARRAADAAAVARRAASPTASSSSTRPKASSRCSTAAATPTRRPAAAICRGSSSAPTAARSSRPAADRAAPTPAAGCRR